MHDGLYRDDDMRSLWCAVILRAIDDARGKNLPASTPVGRQRMIDEAYEWLTIPNAHFNEVCSLAGLDPVAVREGVQRRVDKAGVGGDFPASEGTGGGTVAQDISELEFSK